MTIINDYNQESSTAFSLRGNNRSPRLVEEYSKFLNVINLDYLSQMDPVTRARLIYSINLTLTVLRQMNGESGETDHIRLMYFKYLAWARHDFNFYGDTRKEESE